MKKSLQEHNGFAACFLSGFFELEEELQHFLFSSSGGWPDRRAVTLLCALPLLASMLDLVSMTGKNTHHHFQRKELNVLFTRHRFENCPVLFSPCPCDILLYIVSEEKHFLLLPLEIWKFRGEKSRVCRMQRNIWGREVRVKSNWKAVIIWNSLLMCMIMSLNVNEMELKDPTRRTSPWKTTGEEEKQKRWD